MYNYYKISEIEKAKKNPNLFLTRQSMVFVFSGTDKFLLTIIKISKSRAKRLNIFAIPMLVLAVLIAIVWFFYTTLTMLVYTFMGTFIGSSIALLLFAFSAAWFLLGNV